MIRERCWRNRVIALETTDNATVIIRSFHDDDYPALIALRNAIRPDRTETLEGRQNLDRVLRGRGLEPVRLVVELAGEMIGYGEIVGTGDAQGADIGVLPTRQRQGIGSALRGHVDAILAQRGAAIVRTLWIDEKNQATIGFLKHHGFREREQAWDQTLDLATFDPAPIPDPTTTLAAQGIDVTSLAAEGVQDDSVLRRVHALHNACRVDQPPAEDHREAIPFDAWVIQVVQGPSSLPEALILAKHGTEYIGMVHLARGGEPGVIENGFTGVLPTYRNQGIARTLKLRAIAYARDHGYDEIRTGNHSANGPMLRVNEILGFRKTVAKLRYERRLPATLR